MKLTILIICCAAILSAQTENIKCGTFVNVRTSIENRRLKITSPYSETRPSLAASVLTKSQKIRIHYDTTGTNQPAMVTPSGVRIPNSYKQFIDTLRVLLDSVWNTEIEQFGFEAPPSDSARGGGPEYDFYVIDLGAGYFGQTIWETSYPIGPTKINQQYPSFINIDNDCGAGFRTKGVQAMMATTAHEFHHAIQVGGSGVWEDQQFFFYEMCAEAMENKVFRDANDYLIDVRTYFTNFSTYPLFTKYSQTTPGYERAIWGIFLMSKYGTGIMKDLWSGVRTERPVPAMNTVLNNYSTTVQREFADFSFWNFFTGYRADSARYYPEAKRLPVVSFAQVLNASSGVQDQSILQKSFVVSYYKISRGSDSAFCFIANTNMNDVLTDGQNTLSAKFSYTTSASAGYPLISSSIYGKFIADTPQLWAYGGFGNQSRAACFPNPFNPSTSSLLIPLDKFGALADATLSIYSAVDLSLVFTETAKYIPFSGIQYAEWKGRDNKGNLASSGVYLYVLSKGSTIVKGKFAVIR